MAAAHKFEQPAGSASTGTASSDEAIIGASSARSTYGVDGAGMTVAVIDTGVDYLNGALGGSFGPGSKVIAGYDFGDNSPDPMATSSQHGTAIAGLIASSDPSDLGVAPGVKIVALRVTDSSNTASLQSIANALQWVITNHQQYNITAVNMSLSDGGNYAQNWFAQDGGAGQQVTALIGQLTAMNIPVIAATGNSFSGQQGEGFAAVVAGTISVTATDLSRQFLPNAQRLGSAFGGASATTVAAPGQGLTAPSGDSGTATVEGTSFAAALVTGAVTLLQEIYQARFAALPTVAQLKSWIQGGSTPVHDPVTGITIGELNIPGAARLIPAQTPNIGSGNPGAQMISPPPPAVTPTPTPVVGGGQPAAGSARPANPPSSTSVTAAAPPSAASLQIFVNGQEITTSGSNPSDTLAGLNSTSFASLFWAMNSWAASGPGASGQAVTRIQIWNA
jgi:type VI secretion system secreted protein VgrG